MASIADAINLAANTVEGLLGGKPNEFSRQIAADDQLYWRDDIVCFFELKDGGPRSYLFPLVNGILNYSLSEPFATSVVPTLGSGLGVDEQGVVQRRLTISGHTGCTPHALPIQTVPAGRSRLPKDFVDRQLPARVFNALSGQKHFQYLQDTVFRSYSLLKRDPKTAEGAQLIFHNPREREHWRVIPNAFSLQRGPGTNTTYPFSIDMTIVGPAEASTFPVAKIDRSLLTKLTDSLQAVTDAMANLSGAIDDLTRVQTQFKVFGQKVAGVINSATYVVQSAQSFLAGTKQLLGIPLASVYALFGLCESVCALYADLIDAATSPADWPEAITQRFRATMKACDALLSQGSSFDSRLSGQLTLLANQQQQPTAAAPNTVVATTFAQVRLAGSADLAGAGLSPDGQADDGALFGGPYLSVTQATVKKGDSLAKIAARTLGSGLLWRDIAALNQLRPPWSVAADALAVAGPALDNQTGLLTYGTRILVPSRQPPPAQAATPVVVGAKPQVSADEQLYGLDWALKQVPGLPGEPMYDLDLQPSGDYATLSGPAVVAQSVEQNLVHQRGDVPLFPSVGIDAVVGTGASTVDDTLQRYRVTQALLADPRVSSIARLDLGPSTVYPDALIIDATLVLADGSEVGVQLAS